MLVTLFNIPHPLVWLENLSEREGDVLTYYIAQDHFEAGHLRPLSTYHDPRRLEMNCLSNYLSDFFCSFFDAARNFKSFGFPMLYSQTASWPSGQVNLDFFSESNPVRFGRSAECTVGGLVTSRGFAKASQQ